MTDKVSSGQPLSKSPLRSARFVNNLVDVADAYKNGEIGGPGASSGIYHKTDVVKVQNLTGDDLVRGNVVQLGDHILDDIDPYHPLFESDLVAEPVLLKYAILRNDLPEDDIGEAQVSGRCLALVNVLDEAHTFAVPIDGEKVLDSAEWGPIELLSPVDGEDEQELWVRLAIGGPQALMVKSNGTITGRSGGTPGTGSAFVCDWDFGTLAFVDTTRSITIKNMATGTIATGRYLQVKLHPSGLAVVDVDYC